MIAGSLCWLALPITRPAVAPVHSQLGRNLPPLCSGGFAAGGDLSRNPSISKMNTQLQEICYLCGLPLTDPVSDDHVPPKQFYAKSVRRIHNPNLQTLPTHTPCNKAYQKDEDYFVHCVGPVAMDSYSGSELFKDIAKSLQRPEAQRLAGMIMSEFDQRPSGLYLPHGRIVKRPQGDRITRVIWKIVRGLHFVETDVYLPEHTPRKVEFYSPGEKPSEEFVLVRDTESKGKYPGVFDYKYRQFPELNNATYWGLLFWDKLIITLLHHHPGCPCDKCNR